jgi:hypothetical protein
MRTSYARLWTRLELSARKGQNWTARQVLRVQLRKAAGPLREMGAGTRALYFGVPYLSFRPDFEHAPGT